MYRSIKTELLKSYIAIDDATKQLTVGSPHHTLSTGLLYSHKY